MNWRAGAKVLPWLMGAFNSPSISLANDSTSTSDGLSNTIENERNQSYYTRLLFVGGGNELERTHQGFFRQGIRGHAHLFFEEGYCISLQCQAMLLGEYPPYQLINLLVREGGAQHGLFGCGGFAWLNRTIKRVDKYYIIKLVYTNTSIHNVECINDGDENGLFKGG